MLHWQRSKLLLCTCSYLRCKANIIVCKKCQYVCKTRQMLRRREATRRQPFSSQCSSRPAAYNGDRVYGAHCLAMAGGATEPRQRRSLARQPPEFHYKRRRLQVGIRRTFRCLSPAPDGPARSHTRSRCYSLKIGSITFYILLQVFGNLLQHIND